MARFENHQLRLLEYELAFLKMVRQDRVAISEKNFGLAGRTPVRNNFLVASPAECRSDAGLPDLPEFRNSPDPRIPRFSEIPRFSKFPGNFAV